MKYLVLIPTYNEKENIKKLIREILKQNTAVDILIIDDNSPDGTGDIVSEMAKENKRVNIVHRKGKLGLGTAYIEGFKWGLKNNYDKFIGMDADFSHDPKDLSKFIAQSKNYDLVLGSRYIKGGKIVGWPWYRYLNSWGANLFTKIILGLKTKENTTSYRLYSREFVEYVLKNKIVSSGYAFMVELIVYANDGRFSITEIPITFTDRREGNSKIAGELPRSVKSVLKLAYRRKSYRQFVKFGIIGFMGTVIDLGFYNLFIFGVHFDIYLARAISFTLAATNNYYFNRKWTFQSTDKKVAKEYGKFFFVALIGLGLNLIIMKLLQGVVSNFHSEVLKKNVPVLIAILIVLFWNFFANKYWTFKEKVNNS